MELNYHLANSIEHAHARIMAIEMQLERMEIERRLTTLETVQESILEREKSRIHHTKIADNKPSGMDPMEVNPEHVY